MPKTSLSLIAAIIITAMVVLGSLVPSSAQTNTTNTQKAQHPAQARVHEEPCWQKAGISKDVIDQRQAVEQDTRSQVQSVCADSSLTDPQKKEKIHEIRQETKQKIAGLMTDEQRQDLQSCQKERAASHPAPAGVHHEGAGPCGNMASPGENHAGAPQNPFGGEEQPQQ